MNPEKKQKLEQFLWHLFASCDESHEVVDSNEILQSQKSHIIEQHLFKKPVWNPGAPCIVCSLLSSDQCPKYQENCACTDTTCKHIAKNYAYFEALKKHEQNQAKYNEKLAVAKQAWKQFVRS